MSMLKKNSPTETPLSNPVARDLWWAFASNPLMRTVANLPEHSEQQRQAMLEAIEKPVLRLEALSREEARALIGASNWRVGHYFESLVGFALEEMAGWDLLGMNVTVKRERETMGAFDFVVRNPQGRIEHWEIAVKFYLLLGDPGEWSSWVGPNQRDRLSRKVARMREHQLPLSARPQGIHALNQIGVSAVDHRIALLKGEFFTEWRTPVEGPPSAWEVAQGRWADVGQVAYMREAFPESLWMRRDKPFWLSPLQYGHQDWTQMELPSELGRPEMWSRLCAEDNGQWVEAERWFIVPTDWRDRRRAG